MEKIELKGKIIEVHPDQHQIVVRYWSDQFPLEELSPGRCKYDRAITITQTPMPTGEALEAIISSGGQGVLADMQLRAAIADPNIDTSMKAAKKEMNREFVVQPPGQPAGRQPLLIFKKRDAEFFGVKVVEG